MPLASVTVTDPDCPGDSRPGVFIWFTPGPLMTRLCCSWPLSVARNLYRPGLNVCWESAMWNSVSVAFTPVAPDADPPDPAAADEAPAVAAAGGAADELAAGAEGLEVEHPATSRAVAPAAAAAKATPRCFPWSRRAVRSMRDGNTDTPRQCGDGKATAAVMARRYGPCRDGHCAGCP